MPILPHIFNVMKNAAQTIKIIKIAILTFFAVPISKHLLSNRYYSMQQTICHYNWQKRNTRYNVDSFPKNPRRGFPKVTFVVY